MDLTKVTIGDITYHVEKVDNQDIITGQRYVFFGISWYKVIGFNLSNHIKNNPGATPQKQ
jgi:hypothetical protein